MIVVHADLFYDPADAVDAAKALLHLAAATRREPGCLKYQLAGDLEIPGCLRLTEVWRDAASLQAHFRTPHMAEFQSRGARLRRKSIDAFRFDVSGSGPLFPSAKPDPGAPHPP